MSNDGYRTRTTLELATLIITEIAVLAITTTNGSGFIYGKPARRKGLNFVSA